MAENEELLEETNETEARQKILVADDEASIRRILETRLKMVGYDVVVAEDGEEAVEVFNKTNPDLVVLDVMMPKMDGYGVTREIRRTSDVPIIILTALGDVSERITGLELGADDYVIKPFSPKELEARVKAVLRRTISKDVIIPGNTTAVAAVAGGLAGILYNADLLAEYGEVPVTTDQMLAIMAKITKDRGYSIIQSSNGTDGACYWEHLYPTWWGQYEGYEGYMSFWNGQVNGEYSKDIFKQQGRLESLKTLENVLGTKSKNLFFTQSKCNIGFNALALAFLKSFVPLGVVLASISSNDAQSIDEE